MKKYAYLISLTLLVIETSLAQLNEAPDSLKIYLNRAHEQATKADWVGANASLIAAQRHAVARKDTAALCKIFFGFGRSAANASDWGELKRATELGETYCRACGNSDYLARIFMLKAIMNYHLKQFDASKQSFLQASEIYMQLKDTLLAANALVKVGNVLEEEKQYLEANAYYLKFFETAQKQDDELVWLNAHIYLAANYGYLKDGKKNLEHALEAKRIAQKLGRKFEYCVTLEYEALAYHLLGQHDQAFEGMRTYANYYKDSLMNAERVEQIETLKIQYESEKKESQIALQTAELSTQQRTVWGIGAVLACTLIAGFSLFRLNRKLNKRNAEKEFLIKEIHHRVKNNLQVLSSLLHLQSRDLQDEAALDAVRDGQNRVDTMGLIHQKLYMGENIAGVEMLDYLQDLGDTLLESFGLSDRVAMNYQLQPLRLDVDTAIPLGLIINELVTNSLKYAFPGTRKGAIEIALWIDSLGKLCLKLSDNGIGNQTGIPPTAASKNSTGFGSKLIDILSHKLKGKPAITVSEQGYSTLIQFEQYKLAS